LSLKNLLQIEILVPEKFTPNRNFLQIKIYSIRIKNLVSSLHKQATKKE